MQGVDMVDDGASGRVGVQTPPPSPNGGAPRSGEVLPSSTLVNPMSARLSRPRLPRAFVVRQRLLDLMDAGAQRPVTLICAGAGCGKTLLAASWAATAGPTSGPPGPVAWLALDAEDNNPGVFWTDVLAALRGTGAVPEGTVLASLGSGPSVDKAFIERTVQGLGQLSGPVVLVIDDLHLIDEPQIMRDLAILLRSPPERLRLVLIGRSDSALPLHRLRAAGELTEIRTRDLEFTPDEATRLLAQHGLRLTGPQLALLLGRTEGWAAGLRLAAT